MIILLGYLQMIVGAIHILGAIIRLIIPYTRNSTYKNNITKYLLIVMLYFFILFVGGPIIGSYISEYVGLAYVFVVPWGIAIYYWTIIFSPKNSSHVEES